MIVLSGLSWSSTALAQAVPAAATEQALPAVTVSAGAMEESGQQLEKKVGSGALGSRAQLDTPYSTIIVSGEDLADRQVTKLGDIFALDASVSDNSNANNSWSSYLTVRGLQLDWQNGYKINGMPYVGYGITLPYEQLEQVELLKGLSGFMYGFANPGGTVNYVTRKPTDTFTASVEVGYRSTHAWSQHVDLGGRAGPGDRFGYRLNVTHEEGKPSNAVSLRRDSVSLGLDARLTRDLTWTFDGLYQERRSFGQTPTFATYSYTGASLPGVVSGRGGAFAGPDQHLFTNLQLYSTGLRYRINPDWTVSTNYSFSKVSRSRNETSLVLSGVNGDYQDSRYDGSQAHQFSQWTTMVEGRFRTGPFSHQLVAGTAWQQQINRYSTGSDLTLALGPGNLYQPNPHVYYSQTGFSEYRASDISQKALFLSDTIALTEKWSVLGGVRYTNYEQNGYARGGATTSAYSKNGVVTPTVALLYKPLQSTTLYASYVEALDGGTTVAETYANAGQQLNPLRSKQYEIGAKTDQGRWTGTAALFRIERGAEYVNGSNVYVQDGLSIYQGAELAWNARLGSQWEAGGSVMYLDSYYDKGSAYKGNRVAGAPGFVLAGRLAYRVPFVPGLRLGLDGKYTGTTKLRPAGDIGLGGYTVFNLGASYSTRVAGKDLTLRAALTNLTNKRYWGFQYADYIQPADPRAISLSAKISY